MLNSPFEICDSIILPGERKAIELDAPALYTHTPMNIPLHVINGKKAGPTLFISAAIHGDEINGVEIVRRILKLKHLENLHGRLIAAPIVNIYGFIHKSRYLPDRRDLNRSFPGLRKGSLTSRLARLIVDEILKKCDHIIDLHSGTLHRNNLPQLRTNIKILDNQRLADSFNVPVIINANTRDGSLRQTANEMGISLLVYEGGEALRFDEAPIRAGVRGIINVMCEIGMLPSKYRRHKAIKPVVAKATAWVRAPHSGILRPYIGLGDKVRKGDVLGIIADPFGDTEIEVRAPFTGMVIGRNNLPLANEGEALYNMASFKKLSLASMQVDHLIDARDAASLSEFGEPPIT